MATTVPDAPRYKRKESANYHNAAFSVIRHFLEEHTKNGDVTLMEEHRLSKHPPRIDVIIVKKNRNTEIDRRWAKIFRAHNVIEYKSPVDAPLSMAVFDKVIHGYVGLYAGQEEIKLTDMSATIICFKKPVALFQALEEDFNYKVLRKYKGIYYIREKGCPVEKELVKQIVVSSELPPGEDFCFKALRKGLTGAEARMAWKLYRETGGLKGILGPWFEAVSLDNKEILKKEGTMTRDKGMKKFVLDWGKEIGLWDEVRQEGEQKGRLEEREELTARIFQYLKSGHTLEEAEKEFSLA